MPHVDVDIVIPTRERYGLTLDAVDSVRSQTFVNWRLYVVDDLSDDGSFERLEESVSDPRVQLVRGDGRGPQAARQIGFEIGSALFVAFLDSDDLWHPDKLADQLAIDAEMVLCWHRWNDGPVRKPDLTSAPISTNMSAPLISREALARIGGPLPNGVRSLRTAENIEFFLRTRGLEVAVAEEVLVTCRAHEGPRSSDRFKTRSAAQDLAYVVSLHEATLSNAERGRLWGQVAARYFKAGERTEGLAATFKALGASPITRWPELMVKYGPSALKGLLRGAER